VEKMNVTDLVAAIGAPATAVIVVLWIFRSLVIERRNNRNNPNGAILKKLQEIKTVLEATQKRVEDIWDKIE